MIYELDHVEAYFRFMTETLESRSLDLDEEPITLNLFDYAFYLLTSVKVAGGEIRRLF